MSEKNDPHIAIKNEAFKVLNNLKFEKSNLEKRTVPIWEIVNDVILKAGYQL